ncbi:MAG: putative peptidoglycan glycosyltransferase FtsW [Campylobacterota bacterium]|nr:putative peptidoglycan glycosyltransferase FtsW [Campylobacterota bacterium]
MIDKPLLAGVIALLTLSLVMSYSLSTYTVLHFHFSDLHFLIRQAASVAVGIIVIVVLSKLDPDIWFNKIGFTLFFLFFFLMISMQFMPESMVKAVGGAKRWIQLGPASIAPVEFFKVGFVFFLSWSFSRKLIHKGKMSLMEEFGMFLPYLLIFSIAVVLIAILQKDLGQVVVLAGTLAILFVLAGRSMKFFVILIMLGFVAFVGLILMAPHRMNRIVSWWSTVQDSILSLFPFEAVQALHVEAGREPYQISNALNAIQNGGFWGQGLGNGQFKLGYVSEVHTDFVLAGLTEELGFLGLALVMLMFLFIVFRLNKIAANVKEPSYYLFTVGVALLISLALVINSYGISGMTPIKGIAVPFLSYGGSQIVANSVAIGMVLMISKTMIRREKMKQKEINNEIKEEIPAGKEAGNEEQTMRIGEKK